VSASGLTAPRRSLAVGLALVAVYAFVSVATLRWTDNDVRPLYEGIGPSAPYRWVNPPKEFEPGNIAPERSSTDIELHPDGSQSAGLLTSDSQLVLNVSKGAVPARAGESRVSFVFEPLDPGQLAKVDKPRRATGNAYRVDITYKPSNAPVATLAAPADILLTAPEPAEAILFSPDGATWSPLESRHEPGSGGVSASFTGAGYYLAATSRAPASAVESPDRGYGTVVAIVVVAVLAIALAWTPFVVQRRRSRKPSKGPQARGTRRKPQTRRQTRR
jgi:hypothetical protein